MSRWSEQEIEILKRMEMGGHTSEDIARAVGRSSAAVRGQSQRLGKVSPVKRLTAFERTPAHQIKLVAEQFFRQQEQKPQPKKGKKKSNE